MVDDLLASVRNPLDVAVPDAEVPPGLPADIATEMRLMVRTLAARLRTRLPGGAGLELSDLVQAGNVGLLKAVKTFRLGEGAPLVVYAKFRVRGEMLDLVRRHIGREPTEAYAGSTRTYSQPPTASGTWDSALPAAPESSPQSPLLFRERVRIIQEEIERLPDRYRAVVKLRYSSELTLREIGEALHVNESRACQLHQKALVRLKGSLRRRGVSDFSHL
jgi:RNA polymerase sigma factor for flagellar operon FliA